LRKNPFRDVGCSFFEESQKRRKKLVTPKGMAKSRIWGAETLNQLELCADELAVGGGVGWSYDRRRRRAAHFSSTAAAWLYGRRRRRQTG